jgi:peptide/nickel transport system substrate-binding protein
VKIVNRRSFLRLSAGGAASTLWAVSGCSSGAGPEGAPSSTPIAPADAFSVDGAAATDSDPSQTANRLRMALPGLPDSLDPALFAIVEAYPFGFAVYDALVWVDQTLTPQPMLAERWESTPDQLHWTFHLRPNVRFHHETVLTAADVVYTFERLLDPMLGSVLQPILRFVDRVTAVDEQTVQFDLHAPNVDLPLLLAAPQARIVAHDYPADQLLIKPSGTGPFRFVELIAGERIRYERNPDYWDASRIYLAELHHIQLPDFNEQVAALIRGDVDLLLDVKMDHIAALTENPDTAIIEVASGRYQNLVMRVIEKPFDDIRIRQALKLCVDRSVLLQRILQGRGEMGNDHPVATISPFFADLPLQVYNPETARQLLVEAGYGEGLHLQLITSAVAPGMVDLAYAFQEMARPAGIEIEIIEVKVPADVYLSEYWGRVPFYVSLSEFRPSIYETFAIAYHSSAPWNETGWSSPELDHLLDDARSAASPDRRKEFYKQAQQLLHDEGAVILPYFLPVFSAMRTAVQGFQPHPAVWVDLRDVKIEA